MPTPCARTSRTSASPTDAGSTAAAKSESASRAKASGRVGASTTSRTSGGAQIAVARLEERHRHRARGLGPEQAWPHGGHDRAGVAEPAHLLRRQPALA